MFHLALAMSYDAIYYKKSEIGAFFITISYFKNFQIFTFSKFFFYYPRTIGFRLIVGETFSQCRFPFYYFLLKPTLAEGKIFARKHYFRCYCSLYRIYNQNHEINQRQFPSSFCEGVCEGAWWANLVTMTTVE